MKLNAVLCLIHLPILVLASNVKNLVIFGDANSDVGNSHRGSDGPLWNEYLAQTWNASIYNFAYSGSVCDNNIYSKKKYIPSFKDQVEGYYGLELDLDPTETVYGIWFGLQDAVKMSEIKKQKADFNQVADCLGHTLRSLNKVFKASKFIIFNIPPIEYMPYYMDTDKAKDKSQAVIEINRLLEKDISNLNKHHHSIEVDLVDIHSLVDDLVVDPIIFGYKHATGSIVADCGKPCSSADEYVWLDDTRFSTGFHKTIATSIVESESFTPKSELTKEPTVRSEKFTIKPSKGIIEELVKEYDESRNKISTTYESTLEDEIYSTDTYKDQHSLLIIFIFASFFAFALVKLHKRMRAAL